VRRRPRPKSTDHPLAGGATPARPSLRLRLILNGVLAVAGSLVYLNNIWTPFMFDDMSAVVNNDRIRRLSDVERVLSPERERPVAGRPLVNLSLALNYAFGNLNVVGYHLFNIAVHVLCAIVLFAVVYETLLLAHVPTALSDRAVALGFVVALLWVVHPLNSEVVTYVTQRTESMMAFFLLLTLYASLRAR
jgi:protein O-mannosyl-transferase